MHELLAAIDITSLLGLRDRALIALMGYTFARVGAAALAAFPWNIVDLPYYARWLAELAYPNRLAPELRPMLQDTYARQLSSTAPSATWTMRWVSRKTEERRVTPAFQVRLRAPSHLGSLAMGSNKTSKHPSDTFGDFLSKSHANGCARSSI